MITFLKAGLLTTIQDLGRNGFQKYGVVVSGAMDQLSHRVANLLVGNEEIEATLEVTLIGPTMKFEKDCVIAVCGARFSLILDNNPVQMWRPVFIKKGSVLTVGNAEEGCRGYIAVAGGFSIPEVLKSKSTYLRGHLGGFHGRNFRNGDQLEISLSNSQVGDSKCNNWCATSALRPNLHKDKRIRVTKGRQYDLFDKASKKMFFSKSFEVSTNSDRMGYRLLGLQLQLQSPIEMISEPVSFGTIQVPADGNPIVLLADRQTTGGYPKIAQIITVDLPHFAQAKPGDKITFTEVSHEEAEQLYIAQKEGLAILKKAVSFKLQ